MQVMQVSLAHLWLDFWVIFLHFAVSGLRESRILLYFPLSSSTYCVRSFVRQRCELFHHIILIILPILIWIDKAVVCIPIHVPLSQLKAEGNIDIPQILIAANHRVNSFDGIKIKIFSWILSDPNQQPRTPHLMTMINIIVIVTLMEIIWSREPWLPSWLPRSLW